MKSRRAKPDTRGYIRISGKASVPERASLTERTSAAGIASSAAALVAGDRAINHGAKLENHAKIADVWNGILRAAGKTAAATLDAHDVANLMEGLKIARRYCGAFNLDDYIDGAGYAACAGEIRATMLKNDIGWAEAAK